MTTILAQVWHRDKGPRQRDSGQVPLAIILGDAKGDESAFLKANSEVFRVNQVESMWSLVTAFWSLLQNSGPVVLAFAIFIIVLSFIIFAVLLLLLMTMLGGLLGDYEYLVSFIVMGFALFMFTLATVLILVFF